MFAHGGDVFGQVAPRQNAAVNFGVQGFHPAVEHFGKAGVVGHVDHGEASIADGFGGAAGGQQFDALGGKRAGKFDEAGFVGNRE